VSVIVPRLSESRSRGPGQRVLPFPACPEDGLQELTQAARSAAGLGQQYGLLAYLGGGVGGGARESDGGHHGEVVDVVSDIGDLVGVETFAAKEIIEGSALVGDALDDGSDS
jgi:hypothetical protein